MSRTDFLMAVAGVGAALAGAGLAGAYGDSVEPTGPPTTLRLTDAAPMYGGSTLGNGDYLVITGTGFASPQGVTLNGISATDIRYDSDTQITCRCPPGLTWGSAITVAVSGIPLASGLTVHPAPEPGNTILFDGRAGGAQDMQAAATNAAMRALFRFSFEASAPVGFSAALALDNFLGDNRTQALRVQMRNRGGCGDAGPGGCHLLSNAAVSNIYVAWKWRRGRTTTDSGGDGIGEVDVYNISNIRKCRTVPPAGGRKQVVFGRSGSADIRRTDLDFNATPKMVTQTVGRGSVRGFGTPNFDYYATNPFHFCYYHQLSSTDWATDGISRVWWNAVRVGEIINGAWGSGTIKNVRVSSTMDDPNQDQTEYWWDYVVWTV